ncbi:uncharacterized protein LOC108676258, partial [Hyalella azteca]|uniref:Uncharacterized protein LOC108676258 n=1 Tax=Hyalella azteca TaxID=294128 RepID=A0A8B7P423_HYAAZ
MQEPECVLRTSEDRKLTSAIHTESTAIAETTVAAEDKDEITQDTGKPSEDGGLSKKDQVRVCNEEQIAGSSKELSEKNTLESSEKELVVEEEIIDGVNELVKNEEPTEKEEPTEVTEKLAGIAACSEIDAQGKVSSQLSKLLPTNVDELENPQNFLKHEGEEESEDNVPALESRNDACRNLAPVGKVPQVDVSHSDPLLYSSVEGSESIDRQNVSLDETETNFGSQSSEMNVLPVALETNISTTERIVSFPASEANVSLGDNIETDVPDNSKDNAALRALDTQIMDTGSQVAKLTDLIPDKFRKIVHELSKIVVAPNCEFTGTSSHIVESNCQLGVSGDEHDDTLDRSHDQNSLFNGIEASGSVSLEPKSLAAEYKIHDEFSHLEDEVVSNMDTESINLDLMQSVNDPHNLKRIATDDSQVIYEPPEYHHNDRSGALSVDNGELSMEAQPSQEDDFRLDAEEGFSGHLESTGEKYCNIENDHNEEVTENEMHSETDITVNTFDFDEETAVENDESSIMNEDYEMTGEQTESKRPRGIKRQLESKSIPEAAEMVAKKSMPGKKTTKKSLPRCKMTRTYVCEYCNLSTQNPRDHLYHIRDVHFEAIHIYECKSCQYASKNFTKLTRHMQMVHKFNLEMDESGVKRKINSASYEAPSPAHVKESFIMASKKPSKSVSKLQVEVEESEPLHEDFGEEAEEEVDEVSSRKEDQNNHCDHCDFVGKSQKALSKHEESCHLKRTFYRCSKCAYATQLKGRYTKHMKYHQLPIIKCDFCDFRTPYRWNLDRHCRNHTDESGEHKCHLCNFTAQIKQSLTVHVANHHLTPDQVKERDQKRTIGATELGEFATDEEELELMKMERDEHPDAFQLADGPDQSFTVATLDVSCQEESSSLHYPPDDFDVTGDSRKKKPKIKMTFRKMKNSKDSLSTQEINERHNFEEDFIHPDDFVHRNGNVYMKNYKCDQCSFKAAFKNDLIRHGKKMHDAQCEVPLPAGRKVTRSTSSGNVSVATDPDSSKNESLEDSDFTESFSPDSVNDANDSDIVTHSKTPEVRETRKKAASDDFNEKSTTPNAQNLVCQYCNHNSKCLAESVRHAKLHLSVKNTPRVTSLSAKCQFCQLRCRTTEDLSFHLKKCPEARKNQIIDVAPRRSRAEGHKNEDSDDEDDATEQTCKPELRVQPLKEVHSKSHCNNRVASDDEDSSNSADADDMKLKIDIKEEEIDGKHDTESASTSEVTANQYEALDESQEKLIVNSDEKPASEGKGFVFSKRAYLCPQCKFWSTTASRFHVHIVGHYNKKPYVCSVCPYRSNWRWDITKHIKIKSGRDKAHLTADVLITDETGEKNYEKYEKYVSIIQLDETQACRTEGGIPPRKGRLKKVEKELRSIADDGVEDSCGSTSSTRCTSASSRDDTPVMSPQAPSTGDTSPATCSSSPPSSSASANPTFNVAHADHLSGLVSSESSQISPGKKTATQKPGQSSQPMVCIPLNGPIAMSTPAFPGLPRLLKTSPLPCSSAATTFSSSSAVSVEPTVLSVTAPSASINSAASLTSPVLCSALFQDKNLSKLGGNVSDAAVNMKFRNSLEQTAVLPPLLLPPVHAHKNGDLFKQPFSKNPKNMMKPPPLLPVKSSSRLPSPSSSPSPSVSPRSHNAVSISTSRSSGGQYQVIAPQNCGQSAQNALNTSLQTLQLLASGSTSVTKLPAKSPSSSPLSGRSSHNTSPVGGMSALAGVPSLSGFSHSMPSTSPIMSSMGPGKCPTSSTLSNILSGASGSTSASISSLVALANAVNSAGVHGLPGGNRLSLLNNLPSAQLAGLQGIKDSLPPQLLAGLSSANANDPASKLALQMRLLVWLSLINKEAQKKKQQQQQQQQQQHLQQQMQQLQQNQPKKKNKSNTSSAKLPSSSPSSVSSSPTACGGSSGEGLPPAEEEFPPPQLVLDHQGNPEWKCAACNFRDSDRGTVEQHRSLAHGRSVVSLLHAVHRCDVCAFAAGTKRHVQ